MHRTLERLRAEFQEMPGLRLSVKQVQRLCGVEPMMCQAVLDAMVDAKFLRRNPDSTYARLTDGAVRRAAKADLGVVTQVAAAS